jgi:hypothetical protein
MKLVPRDKESGEIKWGEVIEVASSEDFARDRNARLKECGINREWFGVISDKWVQERGNYDVVVRDWLACEENPFRLLVW